MIRTRLALIFRTRAALILGAVLAAGVLAAFALRAADDSAQHCFADDGEAAIAACTRAIDSGRFRGAELAAIYGNRAIELRQRGDYDRAIADYSEAIRFDTGLVGAYAGRGLAYEGANDIEKAKSDYRKALTVTSKYADREWAQETARARLAALPES